MRLAFLSSHFTALIFYVFSVSGFAGPPGSDYMPGEVLVQFFRPMPSAAYRKGETEIKLLPLVIRKAVENERLTKVMLLRTQVPLSADPPRGVKT